MAVLKDVPAASWKVELAFLARPRNRVGFANMGEDREGLYMVGDKGGIELK